MAETIYTISELAKEFGVTTRTIRFYEEQGLVSPQRDGQKRLFLPADRVRLKLILRGKRCGLTLKESVEIIDMYQPGQNSQQLITLIDKVKNRQAQLKRQIEDIKATMASLQEVERLCEQALENEPELSQPQSAQR